MLRIRCAVPRQRANVRVGKRHLICKLINSLKTLMARTRRAMAPMTLMDGDPRQTKSDQAKASIEMITKRSSRIQSEIISEIGWLVGWFGWWLDG